VHLACLCRQRKAVVDKGYKMVRQGLCLLDALEDAEREEAKVVVVV
jgi:hypothetical protein